MGADGTAPPGRGVSRQAAAKSMSQVDSGYIEGAPRGQHVIMVTRASAFPFTEKGRPCLRSVRLLVPQRRQRFGVFLGPHYGSVTGRALQKALQKCR